MQVRGPVEAEIDFIRLDTFVIGQGIKPDLIKIDTEGFEGRVLAGCESLFNEGRSVILLELHHNRLLNRNGTSRKEVLRLLLNTGYQTYLFEGHRKAAELRAKLVTEMPNVKFLEHQGDNLFAIAPRDIREYWPDVVVSV